MIRALEKSSGEQKEELKRWLTLEDFDSKAKISAVKNIYDGLKIKKLTEQRIQDFHSNALSYLEKLNRPEDRKGELFQFASYLMKRNK
jgi:geranylgeranyl diphosphate synthase type II